MRSVFNYPWLTRSGYTRFLVVVLSTLKQIRQRHDPVLSDFDTNGFEKAFAMFRPSIIPFDTNSDHT